MSYSVGCTHRLSFRHFTIAEEEFAIDMIARLNLIVDWVASFSCV